MFPHEDSLSVAHARVESALKTAWAHGMAGSRPLAVLLAGFDGGEKAASEGAVTALERALAVHCARTHDAVLRRAADEFIALLPDTAPTGARHVGEQIVEAMRGRDGHGPYRLVSPWRCPTNRTIRSLFFAARNAPCRPRATTAATA